jgi:hypothetical protein
MGVGYKLKLLALELIDNGVALIGVSVRLALGLAADKLGAFQIAVLGVGMPLFLIQGTKKLLLLSVARVGVSMVFVLGKAADKCRSIDIAVLGMGVAGLFLLAADFLVDGNVAVRGVIVLFPLSLAAAQLTHRSIAVLGVGMSAVLRQSTYKLAMVIAVFVMAVEHIVCLRLTDQRLHHRGYGQTFLGVGVFLQAAIGFL